MTKTYNFDTEILKNPDMDAGYIKVPINIREVFGVGRLKVNATYDGILYQGSIVNMDLKNDDGSICYIIGVTKAMRKKLDKTFGDTIAVTVSVRD